MTFNDFFTCIETQYKHQLPFVVYRKPRESQIHALLQQNDTLFFVEDFTEQGFVFAPFDDTQPSILIPSEVSKAYQTFHDFNTDDVIKSETTLQRSTVSNDDKTNHIHLVNKAVDAIKHDTFKKVVLSRKETVLLTKNNPLLIFKNLLQTYPLAFVYCWYHPNVGLWLGATPETLIKIDAHQLSIMALAGTQVYQGRLDVTWGDKEYNEQQFVTDFIVDSLKPLVANIQVSNTETARAGSLLHLKTIITATLKPSCTLQMLIKAIHPTPAVCGLPKLEAKKFILQNEHYHRSFYTGFLGELNLETTKTPRTGQRNIENRAYAISKKSTQLYVNLRCMQLQDTNAHIYVGGGITASSHAENEWQETVFKSLIIKNVL